MKRDDLRGALHLEVQDVRGIRQMLWCEVGIALGHLDRGMAEEALQLVDLPSRHHKQARECVPQIVEPDWPDARRHGPLLNLSRREACS